MKSNGRAFWAILLALALLVNITVVSLAEEENVGGGVEGPGDSVDPKDPAEPAEPDDPDAPDDDGDEGDDESDGDSGKGSDGNENKKQDNSETKEGDAGTRNEDKVAPMVVDQEPVQSADGMIEITKTANVSEAEPGDNVVYSITVRNVSGWRNLTNVKVVDNELDKEWDIGTIGPILLNTRTKNFTYSVPDDAEPSTFTNTATVSGNYTYLEGWRVKTGEVSATDMAMVEILEPRYTLTVEANPPEGGNVTGAGSYTAGTAVNISAEQNEGFVFVNWTATPGEFPPDGVDNDSTTFTMPAADATVTANFASEEPEEEEPGMLSITKTAEEGFGEVGETIDYTITFQNNSRQHLFFGKVVDEDLGRCWSFLSLGGPLAPGEERTIDGIKHTLDEGDLDENGDFTNTATVSGYYKQWHTIGCIKFWKWAKAEASDSHTVQTGEEVEETGTLQVWKLVEGDAPADAEFQATVSPVDLVSPEGVNGGADKTITLVAGGSGSLELPAGDYTIVETETHGASEVLYHKDTEEPTNEAPLPFTIEDGGSVSITITNIFPEPEEEEENGEEENDEEEDVDEDDTDVSEAPPRTGGGGGTTTTIPTVVTPPVVEEFVEEEEEEEVEDPVVEEFVEDDPEEEQDVAEDPVVKDYLDSEPKADLPFTGGSYLNLALAGMFLAVAGTSLRRRRNR